MTLQAIKDAKWLLGLPALCVVFTELHWALPAFVCFGVWCGVLGYEWHRGKVETEKFKADIDALVEREKGKP